MCQLFKLSRVSVYIVYGDNRTMALLINIIQALYDDYKELTSMGKVWITTSHIDFAVSRIERHLKLDFFYGSISLTIHSQELPEFEKFLHTVKPDGTLKDGFFKAFWKQAFECVLPDSSDYSLSCTGKEKLDSLPSPVFEMRMTGHSYGVYNAVLAVAHALQALYESQSNCRSVFECRNTEFHDPQPWQLHRFLQGISFNNSAGETWSLDENRGMGTGFDITNIVTFPNNSLIRMKVGRVDPKALDRKKVTLREDLLVWHKAFNQVMAATT
uniref:Uncharacterized protein n=1 Tax=Sphaerodactylus townsendi TaxID=933632 RepID=A0ACB8EVA2_9SAUR